MCGITGIMNAKPDEPVTEEELRRMIATLRHRGPDQFGLCLDDPAGLGSARLSILDLNHGQQPIANEDGSRWIVFNGEIFNHAQLRADLEARGHRFSTRTDTEVILHLYEEIGPECVKKLNGQFAIAIWDTAAQTLFLARDRLGIRPLFYTRTAAALIFGSEIKAILASRRVCAEMDPLALAQIFTFWCPLAPRTVFRGIQELPPGHYLLARRGEVTVAKYWELAFPPENEPDPRKADLEECIAQLQDLLLDAVRIRLRADVVVGAYLSGGLDSSLIAAMILKSGNQRLDTFSIAFDDARFDESGFQRRVAGFLGTQHQTVQAAYADIARVFPDVIWHTETPLMRTAPAPMFLLSQLVRNRGIKVVLTGEGADEFLAGYDIFKEAKIRRFWARQPQSKWRPLLLKRLYPDIAEVGCNSSAILEAFFAGGLHQAGAPDYSHAIRWRNNRRTWRFFSQEWRRGLAECCMPATALANLPTEFHRWGLLERAQFLESTIFLSQYLLSSQGDRMGMAHSVEGRFPFLDHRVVEFCAGLPASWKLRGLQEKYILKKLAREWLPEEIWRRLKRPFRAPIQRSFFHHAREDYIAELLSSAAIKRAGFFQPEAVGRLVEKIESGADVGETDNMALAGILSTQLVHHHFVANFKTPPPLTGDDDVKVCRTKMAASNN
jgi:asparagine synthase (glutamine-hydrolysing)